MSIYPSVIYKVDCVFFSCRALTDLTIPPSVKKFDYSAFEDCRSLEDVNIPSSVVEIGCGTFAFCYSLKSPKIPNSVVEIGLSAFEHCCFTHIMIPSSVRYLRSYVFLNCECLNDVVFEKNSSLREIEKCAFKGCKSLKKIEFPPSLIKILKKIVLL